MMSVLLFALALGANPTQGARVATHEFDGDVAQWGRSCSSLETRFQTQGARLGEVEEGTQKFMASIGVMRTLRRANARACDWVTSGNVDVTAIMRSVHSSLSSAPCYEQARAAAGAAADLPEAERDQALDAAAVLLLSDDCEAETPEPAGLDGSDEEMEEEMDDATDEIMIDLASSEEGGSLMQTGDKQGPLVVVPAALHLQWGFVATFGGWPLVVAAIVMGIVLGLLCKSLVHLIVRIFRWIRCSLFGRSCSEYKPATWLRRLVVGGCRVGGMLFGAAGTMAGVGVVGSVIPYGPSVSFAR